MARMKFAAARTSFERAFAVQEGLSLVPTEAAPAPAWSIDELSMGNGWHDSSWMLRTGLDVIEGAPSDAIPPEWTLRWWSASQAQAAAYAA